MPETPEVKPASAPAEMVVKLEALASGPRLAILQNLRRPKTLGEIEVSMAADEPRGNLSRQAVRKHIDVLLSQGLVKARPVERGYGPTTEYVVDHQGLFALVEDVRELASLRPTVELHAATSPGRSDEPRRPPGPSLILVRGLREGVVFSLQEGERWVLGRRRSAEVSLDYDRTVSSENALVLRDPDGHLLMDIPGSRNGTQHNFRRLAPDEKVRLRHGDVVGVGRSLLLYWT